MLADAALTFLPGILLAAGLAYALLRQVRRGQLDAAGRRQALFGKTPDVLRQPVWQMRDAPDHPILHGLFQDLPVQLRPVVDTLSTRKLPSLWLLITVPVPLDLAATYDFMMRPAGGSTFSNYDHLAYQVASPAGWPVTGIARSDMAAGTIDEALIRPLRPLFDNPWAKELLMSPKGLRLVVQLAEADRTRYGVFRQAEFGDLTIDAPFVRDLLERMVAVATQLQPLKAAA